MDLNGIEGLDLSTLGGADTVTVGDLSGTDLQRANIDLSGIRGSGTGDRQADTVIVDGTAGDDSAKVSSSGGNLVVAGLSAQVQVSGSDATTDNVDVDTLAGDATVTGGSGCRVRPRPTSTAAPGRTA